MIFYVLAIAVYLFIAVYPIMWLAKKCGSPNHGFFSCLMALILSTVLTAFLCWGIQGSILNLLVSFFATVFSLKFCLGTKFFASLVITFLYWIIGFLLIFLLSSFFGVQFADIYGNPIL